MRYYFDWDPKKAEANLRKHNVGFEQAASVILDPLALTVYDEGHSEAEERWATVGMSANGLLLVLVHTFQRMEDDIVKVRVISARKATRAEAKQYREEGK